MNSIPSDFNWVLYKNYYYDLKKLETKEKVEEHWLKYGQYEKRIYKNFVIPKNFDWKFYVFSHIDLIISNINTKEKAEKLK